MTSVVTGHPVSQGTADPRPPAPYNNKWEMFSEAKRVSIARLRLFISPSVNLGHSASEMAFCLGVSLGGEGCWYILFPIFLIR